MNESSHAETEDSREEDCALTKMNSLPLCTRNDTNSIVEPLKKSVSLNSVSQVIVSNTWKSHSPPPSPTSSQTSESSKDPSLSPSPPDSPHDPYVRAPLSPTVRSSPRRSSAKLKSVSSQRITLSESDPFLPVMPADNSPRSKGSLGNKLRERWGSVKLKQGEKRRSFSFNSETFAASLAQNHPHTHKVVNFADIVAAQEDRLDKSSDKPVERSLSASNDKILEKNTMHTSERTSSSPSRRMPPTSPTSRRSVRGRSLSAAHAVHAGPPEVSLDKKHTKKKKKLLSFKKDQKSPRGESKSKISPRKSSHVTDSPRTQNSKGDLSSEKRLNIERFDVFLADDQIHSFFYKPQQKLIELLEKLATLRGLSLETHEPTDGKGHVLDINLCVGDIGARQIFFLKKDGSDPPPRVVVCQDGSIVPRSKFIRERSKQEYEKIIASVNEEIKLQTLKISSPLKKRTKTSKVAKGTVLYSHAHNYPHSQLHINTDSTGTASVLAGTTEALIEVLTHPLGRDNDFELTFIMSSDGFLTPRELFERIIQRWDTNSVAVKENIIDFFKVWLNKRIDILADDDKLKEDFMEWVEHMDLTGLDEMKAKGFKLFVTAQLEGKRSQYKKDIEQMLQAEYLEGAPDSLGTLDIISGMNVDIFCFDPTELARQMTLLDAQLMKKIKPHEWLQQGWMKGKSINIINFITRFNLMSNWISTVVIMGDTKELRAAIITRFVHVAMECLLLNNYNAVLEVITGLTSVACSRMIQTWQLVDPLTIRHLEKLKELVSVNNKFKTLREAQEDIEGPCVPYLGVYLGDLTLIEDGNPDITQNNLINFDKYTMVAQIILRSEQFKNKLRYKLYPVESIQQWLGDIVVMKEDEIFEESLLRESREENTQLKAKLGKKANFV